MNGKLMCLAKAIVVLLLLGGARVRAEDLVLGIDFNELWKLMNCSIPESPPDATALGMSYMLKVSGGNALITIGVWESEELAKDAYALTCRMFAVAPDAEPEVIGDERMSWLRGGQGGSVVFRRSNVSVTITWPTDQHSGHRFAKGIDDAIVGTNAAVKKGSFASVPKIENLPSEVEVGKNEKKTISVTFSGLGSEPVKVWIDDTIGPGQYMESDGKITLDNTLGRTWEECTIRASAVSQKGVVAKGSFVVKPKP